MIWRMKPESAVPYAMADSAATKVSLASTLSLYLHRFIHTSESFDTQKVQPDIWSLIGGRKCTGIQGAIGLCRSFQTAVSQTLINLGVPARRRRTMSRLTACQHCYSMRTNNTVGRSGLALKAFHRLLIIAMVTP